MHDETAADDIVKSSKTASYMKSDLELYFSD